jgi:diaminohydroxyphosphoribosylaminopyrimidine deaminase/5-amino-6-(5-phosphoribosylamino)uracil reductase
MTAAHANPSADVAFMRRALRLARRSEGRVEPNPMVGCVLVRGGVVIGEGRHKRFGGPHAEVEALRKCAATVSRPESARDAADGVARNAADGAAHDRSDTAARDSARGAARGATCYVTLEPCCHHGKTPPCTDALIAAGVARVVAAMTDPNDVVAGGGFRALRKAGIRVDTGVCADEARALMAPYLKRLATGRPWVILKWAQSLDGKIATRKGDSKWITSEAARKRAHVLRGRCDAVIVGVGTVLTDDPELTCRLARPKRIATRIVLDRQLRTPKTATLVTTAQQTPTLIVCEKSAPAAKRKTLERVGCEIIALPTNKSGIRIDRLLDELGRRGMSNVMVEGGGRVLGSFFDAGLFDEIEVFVAPRLIGGAAASGPLHGVGLARVADARAMDVLECSRCGPDTLWRMRKTAGSSSRGPKRSR